MGPAVIEQLAMSAVNPLTALLMLNSFTDLEAGQWIVQSAANSAVGGYVIQLAKQRGIKTVNVVRREGLAEDLMAKGADVVLIDGPDLAAQIALATDNAALLWHWIQWVVRLLRDWRIVLVMAVRLLPMVCSRDSPQA